jgi:hypothetical protein
MPESEIWGYSIAGIVLLVLSSIFLARGVVPCWGILIMSGGRTRERRLHGTGARVIAVVGMLGSALWAVVGLAVSLALLPSTAMGISFVGALITGGAMTARRLLCSRNGRS